MSGSLGEMMWERKLQATECFHSFFEFSQTFMKVSFKLARNTDSMFLFLLENSMIKKGKQLVNFIKM